MTTVLLMVLAGFAAVPAGAGDKEVRVIVMFDGKVNEQAIKDVGGKVLWGFKYIPGVVATMPEGRLNALANKGSVDYIELDAKVSIDVKPAKPGKPGGEEPPAQPDQVTPWGIARIGADGLSIDVTGVKVAVVDTGIDKDHPDLNVVGGINMINTRKSYDDDNGHGTHCAGIIGAYDNTIGVVGVAPGVQLYAVKVLDRRGSGYYSTIIAGIEWAIDNDMDVISMSLSGGTNYGPLETACDNAQYYGSVVVAASGNDGATSLPYPAAYSSVISVGATDINDDLAWWSNTGTGLDIVAPGVSIYSTYKGDSYATYSGTSMACPHVAGTAALVIANVGSGWVPSDIQDILEGTADDLGDVGYDTSFGNGLVDADGAVA